MKLLVVILTIAIPAVLSISLPANRIVCETTQVLIVDEVIIPVFLNFSTQAAEISSIVKQECEAWRYINVRPRSKRALGSIGGFFAWIGSLVVKTFPAIANTVVNIVKTVAKFVSNVVGSIGKVLVRGRPTWIKNGLNVKGHIQMKVESANGNVDRILNKYSSQKEKTEYVKKTKKSTSAASYEGFKRDFANILKNSPLGDFMNYAPDIVKSINESVGYTIPNMKFFNHLQPKNVRCTSDQTISFEISFVRNRNSTKTVEKCEDIGHFDSVNQYFFNEIPEYILSNSTDLLGLDTELCTEDDNMLVCVPDAIQPADCSVHQIDYCDIQEMSYEEGIRRQKRLGVDRIESANLSIPFVGVFSNGFPLGKTIKINGNVEEDAEWFEINLIDKNGDISLHIKPRFDSEVVVLNSFSGGKWHHQEIPEVFPFEEEEDFELTLKREHHRYTIHVNGHFLTSFLHRSDPKNVRKIGIAGHVKLDKFQII